MNKSTPAADSRIPIRALALPALLALGLAGAAPLPALAAGALQPNTVLISGSSTNKTVWREQAELLGFTVETADDAAWNLKSTADFATYRAIIIPDRECSGPSATAVATRATWGAAVTGNVLVVGGDPDYHAPFTAGATQLIQNGIGFAAAWAGHTGAYLPLGCGANTTILEPFGAFTGGGFSTDNVHVVAVHPALAGLDDATLSNWGSSTHVGFSAYPPDFSPLAIQPDNNGAGRSCFADASCGVAYLLAKGDGLQAVGLNISAAAPASVAWGQNITYTITYGNTGNSAANAVVIRNPMPAGTTFVSATGGGALVGGSVEWSLGALGAGITGQTVTFTVLPTVAGDITNAGYTIEGTALAAVAGASVVTSVAAPVGTPQSIVFGPVPVVAVGGTAGLTATGGGSGNPVVFSSLSPAVCSVSGSVVTGLSNGNCVIAADQAGGAGWLAAPQVLAYLAPFTPTANLTALWWDPAESGWGVNVNHQGDTIFATLFTYAADGEPLWLVASNVRWQWGSTFEGKLYRTRGPAFDKTPWTGIDVTPVGDIQFTFAGLHDARIVFNYFEGEASHTVVKNVHRMDFQPEVPVCIGTTGSRATEANVQDLWWNPSEPGWGVDFAHQGSILFGTLYTYDDNGRDLWLVASRMERQADGSYLGDLLRTASAGFQPEKEWAGITWRKVGTMEAHFDDGETGVLTYSVDGRQVMKRIWRQKFSDIVPACRYQP